MASGPPSPFDPQLATIAKVLPRGATERSLQAVRRLGDAADSIATRIGQRRGKVSIVDSGDGWSARVFQPPGWRSAPHPALLWIHGGGYVIGSASQEDALCAQIAAELGAVVAAVDYRRAPEHPFPTPLEDCYSALTWLSEHDDVDTDRVAIGGASAGGGLTAALALLARDRGDISPVFQLLSYPMLDDRTATRADIDERGFRLWNNRANHYGWRSYLSAEPGSDGIDGLAAPARHHDLAGVAPAWLGVGTLDLFLDEDVEYAGRLQAAGVSCQLDLYPGAFHAFDYAAPNSDIAASFRSAMLGSLAAAFGVN